jgi:hypothetical protein
VLAALILALLAEGASPMRATATCAPIAKPGRVRCEIEEAVDAPLRIAWADVEVVRAPAFLVALRGRIGPADATAKTDAAWRFGFTLVAREAGEGDVALRARAVVCDGDRCAPREVDAVAHVVVGAGTTR